MSEEAAMPLLAHLDELRRRLLMGGAILAAACALAYPCTGALMERLARPLGQLVFYRPLEAFDTRLLLSFYLGLLASLPLLVREAWLFIGPALPDGAKRLLLAALPASYLLFACGAALALAVVLPPATAFFMSFGTSSVRPFISVEQYVAFSARLALSFGLAFQTPLVMAGLGRLGLATRQSLAARRREFYFLAFILGAVLTSPEVLTQISLAVPLIALYEVGLLLMV